MQHLLLVDVGGVITMQHLLLVDVGGVIMILVATLVLWLGGSIAVRKLKQLPPGPFPLPIVGNLLHILGALPHQSLAQLAQRHGPIVYLQLGCRPAVVVSSPKLARELLQTQDKVFASRPPIESAKRLNYGGDKGLVSAPYGAEWREMRKKCRLHLFTAKRIQEFHPIMKQEIKLMLCGLHKNCAKSNTPVDLTSCVGTLLEDIICRILLGQRLSDLQLVSHDAHLGVFISLKQLLHQATVFMLTPVIGDLIPSLGLLDYKVKGAMDEWHSTFDNLVEGILQAKLLREKLAAKEDFVDVLLADVDLSRDKVKSIILEMLVGGIDTSAVTVDWAMAELLANPHVLAKLQEEVDAVVGPDRMVAEADLPALVYTKAVVKETFRKHPPAPLLAPHMSTQASNVAGYTLPQGTRVLVNAWAIGRDPQVWDQPERFMPERFLEARGDFDVRGQHFELLPFSSGRRSCPGLPLALPIIELAISNLVHTFQWVLPPDHKVDLCEKFGAVVGRASPLMAIPSLRLLSATSYT